MSSTTFTTATSRHARPSSSVVSRVRQFTRDRREAARARRDLDAILAGHHGRSMRDEIQSVIGRA